MSVPNMIKTLTTTILNLVKTRANGDLSNLTDLGEQKLRLSSSVSGFYVGDIGIAIGGIDESKGARKYLNGQKFSLNEYPDFKNWLEERKKACPSAFVNTEAEWNEIQANSDHAQCGKFYYNAEANVVKLPRIVIIQGTTNMSTVGVIKNAGIPNIIGRTHIQQNTANVTGAFTADTSVRSSKCDNTNGDPDYTATFNANNGATAWNAKASGIYGGSTTVQPESIQYPYFIQVKVSTDAVTHTVNDLDIDLNNPFSLFDIRWSDHRIDNLSWLVSNGQYNEGNAYPTAYKFLQDQYNNGSDQIDTITYVSRTNVKEKVTKSISYRVASNGMKITKDLETYKQLLLDTGTAWYYVLDPTFPGFYLPLTDGSIQGGTNESLGKFTPQGLPNITGTVGQGYKTTGINGGWHNYGNTDKSNGGALYLTGTTYGNSCTWDGYSDAGLMAIDASRSNASYGNNATQVQPNGVRGLLYFYVGECVRGANIIDFEGMKSQILNEVELTVQNFDKHRVIESYKNGESWYREYADGWCEQGGHVIPDAVVKLPVSLLRPFIDTSYTVVFGNEYTTTANATSCVETATKAVDSFVIIDSSVKTFGTYWVAYGFVK
jgi:hypothetical protein